MTMTTPGAKSGYTGLAGRLAKMGKLSEPLPAARQQELGEEYRAELERRALGAALGDRRIAASGAGPEFIEGRS